MSVKPIMCLSNVDNKLLTQLPAPKEQGKQLSIFSTGDCFLMLHNKNLEFKANIRGMINHEYNRSLEQKGLTPSRIPGGEDIEQLGMDQMTHIIRPDLYYQAYQKVLSRFTSETSLELKISTSNFFDLLQQENIAHNTNIRGLINQRYNQLLCETNASEEKIPGDNDLERLGLDQTTSLRANLYLQAYEEILASFEKTSAKNSLLHRTKSISNRTEGDSRALAPKIALSFDENHQDPTEITITDKLSKINSCENIIFFRENRWIETPSLNQYSVELLGKDKNISTSSSCLLLAGHILAAHNLLFLKTVISVIYSDVYFKKLFTGKYYSKYDPNQFGLQKKVNWPSFDEKDLSPKMNNAIKNVEGLFKLLDEKLSQIPAAKQEDFFEGHMHLITDTMINRTDLFDVNIFASISEALAFLKIREVHKKLSPQEEHSKELSLSIINQLYSDKESATLLEELALKFRTHFQAKKVIMVIERILKKEAQDPNPIFVVRLGSAHREMIKNQLTQHFKNGVVKEIFLSEGDLPQLEKKIKDQFFG